MWRRLGGIGFDRGFASLANLSADQGELYALEELSRTNRLIPGGGGARLFSMITFLILDSLFGVLILIGLTQ